MAKVPARYVGAYPINLRQIDGPHFDADGRTIRGLVLRPGDTLMIHAQEAFGQTLKWDPAGNTQPLYLGVGRVVLPDHVGLPDDQLAQLGYEFQGGSSNWLPLVEPSRGPVPEESGEEPAPLGSDAAADQLAALADALAAQPGAVDVPPAPPTPEELADRAFRRRPRSGNAAQAEQAAAAAAAEQTAVDALAQSQYGAAPAAPEAQDTPDTEE